MFGLLLGFGASCSLTGSGFHPQDEKKCSQIWLVFLIKEALALLMAPCLG